MISNLKDFSIIIVRQPYPNRKSKNNEPEILFKQEIQASSEVQAENYGEYISMAFRGNIDVVVTQIIKPTLKGGSNEKMP